MDISKNTRPTVNLAISYREASVIMRALNTLVNSGTMVEAPASMRAEAERMHDELQAIL